MLGDRPRGRVRPARRRDRRRVHPPGRAGRAPEPVRPARRRAGPAGHPHPPRPVPPHRHRGAARRRPVPSRARGAGQGDHDRLPAGRDHLRPADLGAARAAAARPRRRAARREDRSGHGAGRPARPVHRGQPRRAVRRPDHHPPRRAPGRLLPPRRPRRAAARRDPARPGRHLADGLRPRPAQAAADHRGRGVAADARPRGRQIPVPAGEVRQESMGRAGRGHPGRRGRAVHRPGPGGHRQQRHPDPAPPGPPGHRQGGGGVPAVGRGAAAVAVRPPGRGPAGRRAVRPGLVPGPGLARRAFSLHE